MLAELITIYKNMSPEPYDFTSDPLGLLSLFEQAEQFARDFPVNLKLPAHPTAQNVMDVVLIICNHFKQLIENNGTSGTNTVSLDRKSLLRGK